MVCRAADEHHARDGGAGHAGCRGGCVSRLWRDSVGGYTELDGLLRFSSKALGGGKSLFFPGTMLRG